MGGCAPNVTEGYKEQVRKTSVGNDVGRVGPELGKKYESDGLASSLSAQLLLLLQCCIVVVGR